MPELGAHDPIGSWSCRRKAGAVVLFISILLMAQTAIGDQIRIAVLKFGTASWELDTIRHHGLDRKHGVELDVIELAGKQATMVALQGHGTDVALTDWHWVSRQRAAGMDFSFIPYSTAAGSLVVPKDSEIRSLQDLAGRRIGIAGGPLDKNWLLFRALAISTGEKDLAETVVPVFGAPPLLNKQLEQGRIDAVINFWPYVARLTAQGMRPLMSAQEAAQKLGIHSALPLVGHVFDASWARSNPRAISGFIAALAEAREELARSDAEWERLQPLMRAPDQATFEALRDGWRAGIPGPMDATTIADAALLFDVLAKLGGKQLVGDSETLSPGTFWGVDGD